MTDNYNRKFRFTITWKNYPFIGKCEMLYPLDINNQWMVGGVGCNVQFILMFWRLLSGSEASL